MAGQHGRLKEAHSKLMKPSDYWGCESLAMSLLDWFQIDFGFKAIVNSNYFFLFFYLFFFFFKWDRAWGSMLIRLPQCAVC